jgi:hypothetical protein
VTIYNEKTRVYYQTPLVQWEKDMASRGISAKLEGTWNKAGQTTICGMKATVYQLEGSATLHGKKNSSHSVSTSTCYIADNISVPPQLVNMLNSAYGLPATTNLPLKVTAVEQGTTKNLLETYRAQPAPIPISYFNRPEGLTLVKSDAEVMMTSEQQEIVNDMARELDTDSRGRPTARGRTAASAAGTGEIITVGGVNLDKGKVKQLLDGLKNGNSR